MITEEEAPEVGPNDIVIHLVNPYKCGVCELEFLDKPVFKVGREISCLYYCIVKNLMPLY